ncbi:hypothetical protein [Parabacteroides pacaensis]|uniref:hypothetical protein n=1 Tax=Parabacteroides pacaensis TaxID=2086575 RepID=UPI00131B88D9|nr:hypothetical protein [Parabacteroides pacaensis]
MERKQYIRCFSPALRFRRWSRKGYAAFVSRQRACTMGTLRSHIIERLQNKNIHATGEGMLVDIRRENETSGEGEVVSSGVSFLSLPARERGGFLSLLITAIVQVQMYLATGKRSRLGNKYGIRYFAKAGSFGINRGFPLFVFQDCLTHSKITKDQPFPYFCHPALDAGSPKNEGWLMLIGDGGSSPAMTGNRDDRE